MSNFAERLAARAGGGANLDVATLTPRPASRFEASSLGALEAGDDFVAGDEHSSDNAPVSMTPLAGVQLPTSSKKIEHPKAIEETRYQRRLKPVTADVVPTHSHVLASDSFNSTPGAKRSVPAHPQLEPITKTKLTESRQVLPDVDNKHSIDQPFVEIIADESRQGTLEVQLPAAGPHRLEPFAALVTADDPAPATQITIGKIEVQFMPQESRIPPARPLPERTHGFAAYARARRGNPR